MRTLNLLSKYLLAGSAALSGICAIAQLSDSDYVAWATQALERVLSQYPEMKTASFSFTKKGYALTRLAKSASDKEPLMFWASITPSKEGADLGFKTSRPCIPDNNRLFDRIILVSGQKVDSAYMCIRLATENQEVFVIKSAEGKAFVHSEFAQRPYVFVELDGLPVPFKTEGFSSVLKASDGKAL